MQNIITRLRESSALPTGLYSEAAAEIERQRAALQEIERLRGAIEAMRVAGGKQEFQAAFDAAKALL